MSVDTVQTALIDHHIVQGYCPEEYYSNVVASADGVHLGPYIPYVGDSYLTTKPRVLIYAMAQNLGRSPEAIGHWLARPDKGMRRHYWGQNPTYIRIGPYDMGHLKVIAALALSAWPGTSFEPSQDINEQIAITNFVKFSFYREKKDGTRMDANPPQGIYDTMWESFCSYEVELLQPDIIIGVGGDVTVALRRGLNKDGKDIAVAKVAFPGRLNLNSRWVPKGKELISVDGYDPGPCKAELCALMAGTPDPNGRIHRAIETDWHYFQEMKPHCGKADVR